MQGVQTNSVQYQITVLISKNFQDCCRPDGAGGTPDFDRSVNPTTYINRGGEGLIIPTTLLLANSNFQTFLRPFVVLIMTHFVGPPYIFLLTNLESSHI